LNDWISLKIQACGCFALAKQRPILARFMQNQSAFRSLTV